MTQTDNLTNLKTVPFVMLKPIAHSIVKGKAHQAIISKYPYWKQLNIIRNGTESELLEMTEYIDKIRAKSDELEQNIIHCRSRACVLAILDEPIQEKL